MSEPQTVKIGEQEFELGRIAARPGLRAAQLIIPHLNALRPSVTLIAKGGTSDRELVATAVMDAAQAIAPLVDPDTFLEIAQCVTGVEAEVLGQAPLEDVLLATAKGLTMLDLRAIGEAAGRLFRLAAAQEGK